jgi:hypothetical protein
MHLRRAPNIRHDDIMVRAWGWKRLGGARAIQTAVSLKDFGRGLGPTRAFASLPDRC